MLSEILGIYERKGEIFCRSGTEEIIRTGYKRIAESENINLIKKCLESFKFGDEWHFIKAFYKYRAQKGYINMNPQETLKSIEEFLGIKRLSGPKYFEPSEVTFFVNVWSFLFQAWKEIDTPSSTQEDRITFVSSLSNILERLVHKASEEQIDEIDEKINAMLNELRQFQERLKKENELYSQYKGTFLSSLTDEYQRVRSGKRTIIHLLYENLLCQSEGQ